MPAEFRMPSLGADMTEGTVLDWLIKPGATVHKGDIVAVVDTSKAAVEVECFQSGVVTELLVPEGSRVPVGTPLARIDTEVGNGPAPAVEPTPPAEAATMPAEAERMTPAHGPAKPMAPVPQASPPVRRLAAKAKLDLSTVRGTGRGHSITRADVEHALHERSDRRRIAPYARRLATELGVDPATVTGSGSGGAVRAQDIRDAAAPMQQPEQEPEPHKPEPKPKPEPQARRATVEMRQAIAALMARSKREIPHYYLTATIDMAAADSWLREYNRQASVSDRLVAAALLLKASALAARTVPEMNGYWENNAFVRGESVHLGVAVSLRGGGLVAPAIMNADDLDLAGIMRALRDLVSRVRSGRLRGAELTSATITVSNLGDLGVDSVHGVIYPPQVALVGFGAIARRPCAVGDLLGIRPMVTATLAGDHRASDGATGARYLKAVDRLLNRPEEL